MIEMADNRGKIFEREFRQGLLLLGGMAIRLFDGMSYAKQRQPADFIYAAQNHKNYLIECKSTKQKSFPYANIQQHQLDDLRLWHNGSTRLSLFAIEFWSERRMFLISAYDIAHLVKNSGRKSLTTEQAETYGFECKRMNLGGKLVYDLSILEKQEI